MNRIRTLSLMCLLLAAGPARAAGDFSWRVSSCVRWLASSAQAALIRDAKGRPTRHNLAVFIDYARRQNLEIMRHGPNHSPLTRYVSLLPEFTQLFLRRNPRGHQIYFVINSGGEVLYTDQGHERMVFPPNEVLAVWRDSHLVFRTFPVQVLDQLIERRTPEKLVIEFLNTVKFDHD